jgi:hypothetical protein
VKGGSQPSGRRPLVTSYDSGYEHSLEHWLNVQQLVEADEKEPSEDTFHRQVRIQLGPHLLR